MMTKPFSDFVKQAYSCRPIWQWIGIYNLGNVLRKGTHGSFVVRKVLLEFVRRKRNGDIIRLCGVTDFEIKPNNSLRYMLDAIGVKGLEKESEADNIMHVHNHLETNRPGIRMKFKVNYGHISITKAESAAFGRDCGEGLGKSALGAAIFERYTNRKINLMPKFNLRKILC